jgi:prepilin-type processing-associated H-X9-DG protein
MKQLGLALSMYVQDYDEMSVWFYRNGTVIATGIPLSGYWYWNLYPYVKNWAMYGCPSRPNPPMVWDSNRDGIADVPDLRQAGYGIAWAHIAGCRGYVRSYSEYKAPANTLFVADSSIWARPGLWGLADSGWQDVYCPIATHPEAGLHDCFRDNCSSNNGAVRPPSCWISKRHNEGSNCTFVDGHTKWYKYDVITNPNPPAGGDIWGHTTTPRGGDAAT